MKLIELIPLTAAAVNLALTLAVLSRNAKTTLGRVYALWGLSITVWNIGTVFMFQVRDPGQALFWARFLHFGVIFLPLGLFHLCLLIAHISKPTLVRALYVLQILFAASNFTGLFVSGVRDVGYAYYSVGGPVYGVFVAVYAVLTWGTMVMLVRRLRTITPMHRSRVRSMLWASGILIAFGNNDLLPILGIYHYPFTNIQIFPFGSLAAIFYGLLVGYSTLQHQLLDVQFVFSRLVAHSIRLTFMFLLGVALLLVIYLIAPSQFTAVSFFSALFVLLVSGITASLYFPRLFGRGPESWERRFLGDRFEYHDQLRGFIATMQWYTDANLLLNDLNDLLVRTVGVRSYQIILRDDTNRAYSLLRCYPEGSVRELPELKTDSPVFRFFETTGVEYLAFNLLYAVPGATDLEREAREILKHFDAEFCLPFMSEEDPFGLMLLGPKASEEPYTATDISLIVSLVRNLSLIINQIRLKTQILQAQEMELMGRMSRGMAHDMNNLVTPVQTLLQLMNEGVSPQYLREDLLPLATRSIEMMREYVREALFFSENARPDYKLGRLDVLLAEAAEITAPRRAGKAINIAFDPPGEVLVEMDKSLILRMVVNIIANAADASPPHSTIRIELVRLLKTEVQRDWLRVRIIDSGEGIKPEDMNRIFTPYFTTKDRGDKDRGFGLGLSICRKVVQLHGGSLNVMSQRGKGTTVQIDLPDRQIVPTVPEMLARVAER